MKKRKDKIIERILANKKEAQLSKVPRANTLAMVKMEAVRRAREDGGDRIIYMTVGAELCIRLAGEDKAGDQTSLCYVRHDGKIVDVI
jgi:hypothetical protein